MYYYTYDTTFDTLYIYTTRSLCHWSAVCCVEVGVVWFAYHTAMW